MTPSSEMGPAGGQPGLYGEKLAQGLLSLRAVLTAWGLQIEITDLQRMSSGY